jgi:hypothetical protein
MTKVRWVHVVVRQRTLAECMKKRRAIAETDSDEEEGGSV